MVERSNRFWVTIILAGLAAVGLAAVGLPAAYRVYHERKVANLETMARACLAEGKDDQAAAVLDHYLTYRPNDLAAQRDHARLRFEQSRRRGAGAKQLEKAQAAVSAAVSKNPDDLSLRRQLAITLLDLGRRGAAKAEIADLRTRAAAAGGSPEAAGIDLDELALLEARACAGNDNIPEAIALAAGIVGFDPATGTFAADHRPGGFETEASLLLAGILADKDEATAGRVLERLEETAPEDVRVWLSLARWHAAHGDARRAEADAAKAVAIDPDNPEVLGTAFTIALTDGRHDEATRMAERWRDLAPGSADPYVALATVARAQNDAPRAVDALRAGLEELPEHPLLLVTLTDTLLRSGQLDEAETALRPLAERMPADNPTPGMLEARLLVARRQWLPAQRKLESMRPLVAGSPELKRQVDLLLAECHARLGQFDEQLAASKRVLSSDHTSLAARIGAAEALAAAGKTAEALAEFEAIAATVGADDLPRRPALWGQLLRLRGLAQLQRPAAERDWSKVEGLLDSLEAAGTVGAGRMAAMRYDFLVTKGDLDGAAALLRRAQADHPDDADVFERAVLLTLREEGGDAAKRLLDAPPAAIADEPRLLLVRARLATLARADEAKAILDGLDGKAATLSATAAGPLLAGLATMRLAIGDVAGAERTWRTMLERNPDDLQTRLALFEMACEANDVAAARGMAEEIGRRCGDTSPQGRATQAATILLEIAARRGRGGSGDDDTRRLAEVRDLLKAAEADRPGWATVQQLFAELELSRGDAAAAVERLRRTAELRPDDLRVTRRLVALLAATDRGAEAKVVLDGLGRDLPPGFERIAGQIDLANGRPGEAVARAERVITAARPLSADDLAWFGDLLVRAGNRGLATRAFERIVAADPRNPTAWTAVVAGHVAAKNTAAAERALDEAEKQLTSPARELVLAGGRELLGRVDDAERTLRDGLAAAPDSPELMAGLAELLARNGRFAEARVLLRELAAADGDGGPRRAAAVLARRTLLRLAARDGSYRDVEEAITELDRTKAADGGPTLEDIALKAAVLSTRPEPRAWQQALAQYERLVLRRKLTVPERMQRAALLDRTGHWEDCRKELLAMATEPEPVAPVLAAAVEKLIAHGDIETAALHLRALAEKQPQSPLVAGLEARLAIASRDRPAAVAAVRRLSAAGDDAAARPDQLEFAAKLVEELGFDRAADDLLAKFAARSPAGTVARAEFLARKQRGAEALDLLDESKASLAPTVRLRTAIAVLRLEGTAASPDVVERVVAACAAIRRSDPDDPTLTILEAELRALEDRRDDAVALYRHVLDAPDLTPPQRMIAQNNLAMLLARGETAGEARRLIDTAIADHGPHPSLLDTQGVVMIAAGATDEAITVLREALLDPSPEKHLHLACALAARQRFEAARQSLADARKAGLDVRRLDADDRERLEAVEAAIGKSPS